MIAVWRRLSAWGNLSTLVAAGAVSSLLYVSSGFAENSILCNGLDVAPWGVADCASPRNQALALAALVAYVILTSALFATYVWLLSRVRASQLNNRQFALALAIPVLVNVAAIFQRPLNSSDLFTYAAQGYLGTIGDFNPYLHDVREIAATPFGGQLASFGWSPTEQLQGIPAYGPLWIAIEVAAVRAARDLSMAMVLMKSIVVVASLASAAVIWQIMRLLRPGERQFAVVAYLWNPLVILEFAREGHNDAVMTFFVLLAMLLAAIARPGLGVAPLVAGALTKFVPLVLVPAQVLYSLRASGRSYLRLDLAVSVLLAIVATVALYLPFWAGPATFAGAIAQSQPGHSSPTGVVRFVLERILAPSDAARVASGIVLVLFGGFVAVRSFGVRKLSDLLSAAASIVLVYVLLVSPAFWPWYAVLPCALALLVGSRTMLVVALVLTFAARVVAPIDYLLGNGNLTPIVGRGAIVGIGIMLPCAIFVAMTLRERAARGSETMVSRAKAVATRVE